MKHTILTCAVALGLSVSGLAYAQAPGGAATRATPNSAPGSTVAPGLPGTPTGHAPSQPSPASSGYATEAAAKQACGNDTVVWGMTDSKVMSTMGSQGYGQPGTGAYMCQKQAMTDGYALKSAN